VFVWTHRPDHLYAKPVFIAHYRKKPLRDIAVVAPDVGSAKMARGFAKELNGSLAIIDKRRPTANVAEVLNVVGEVEGKDCILTDDMIDTAGTMVQGASALKEAGAGKVLAAATHAVLSGSSLGKINDSVIEKLIVTNTIPLDSKKELCPKLTVLCIAQLIAEAIKRIHEESSISSLFI
jgi:ribose-phosphate pyrophosphokinase